MNRVDNRVDGKSLNIAELGVKVAFDPIVEWGRIKEAVVTEMAEAGEGANWDKRVSREHRHIGDLARTLIDARVVGDYSEVFERLRAVDRASWGLEAIQRTNSGIYEGFDVGEIISHRVLAEMIGVEKYHHDAMAYWRETGKLDKKWVPIDTVDALAVSSGLAALAMKEGIPLGRNVVDLGGGDGTWGFALAQMGYDVTLIERDSRLLSQFEIEKNELEARGVRTGNIKSINGEFSNDDTKNSPDVRNALTHADVMVCYPWPEEIVDRMSLFGKYGKGGSILVMYGSGIDSFAVDSLEIEKLGLDVVGREMDDELKKSKGVKKWVRGFDAPSFGASWVVLRKSTRAN